MPLAPADVDAQAYSLKCKTRGMLVEEKQDA